MSASQDSNYRCNICKSGTENSRNLAVFIDGTSNKFGPKNTNVAKLFRQVNVENNGDKQNLQFKNYWSGIGTQSDGLLDRCIDKLFAWNVEENVMDAYRWLVEIYQPGDRIYLFGFSRGAYQVRALAGLIHEVGLTKNIEHIEVASKCYRCIRADKTKARERAREFKMAFCWSEVRIHFVGVWDTVSSVGLVKSDAFVSASASVTNSCYFRHALALDERRVKFMPEYFLETNAHQSYKPQNAPPGDRIMEVWFAGSHSDVGGLTRPNRILYNQSENERLYHAGHASFAWMRQEASAKGLILDPEDTLWIPEDIDYGRKDSMTPIWSLFEIVPVRHQVTFSGMGKHARRSHYFQPRRIIPGQKIHISVLFGGEYTTRATLGNGIDVPVIRFTSWIGVQHDGLLATESRDNDAMAGLLKSLLESPRDIVNSLERVLFLLQSGLQDTLPQNVPETLLSWTKETISNYSDFPKLALTVIYFATSKSITKNMADEAGRYLIHILSTRSEHPDFPRALALIRFLTRYPNLASNTVFIPGVVQALMAALKRTVNSPRTDLFLSVIDSLCNLIGNENQRSDVINELCTEKRMNVKRCKRSIRDIPLLMLLDVKEPKQLEASLRLISSIVTYQPCRSNHSVANPPTSLEGNPSSHHAQVSPHSEVYDELSNRICKLAKEGKGLVGSLAVNIYVALNPEEDLTLSFRFSNVLRYLGNTLPRLDAEIGVLPHSEERKCPKLDNEVLKKLVLAIGRGDTRERTYAILTLLKLFKAKVVGVSEDNNIFKQASSTFIKQLQQEKTSLLAAYALKTCLDLETAQGARDRMRINEIAQNIAIMLKEGWFDDAVGQIEGFEIFRGLMAINDLRNEVIKLDIVKDLVKKLEVNDHHSARMVSIALDVLMRGAYEGNGRMIERKTDDGPEHGGVLPNEKVREEVDKGKRRAIEISDDGLETGGTPSSEGEGGASRGMADNEGIVPSNDKGKGRAIEISDNGLETGGMSSNKGEVCGDERAKKQLEESVTANVKRLENPRRKTQSKGVNVLTALAQTEIGLEFITPHVDDIVKKLLPKGYPKSQQSTNDSGAHGDTRNMSSHIRESDPLTTPQATINLVGSSGSEGHRDNSGQFASRVIASSSSQANWGMPDGSAAVIGETTAMVATRARENSDETNGNLSTGPSNVSNSHVDHSEKIQPVSHSQIFGPASTVYALCRNEKLREQIKNSRHYASLMHLHHTEALYHWPR